MVVQVNGEPQDLPDGTTVEGLVALLGVKTRGFAVERNQEVVPRTAHASTRLAPGDRIEVVTLVGGG